MTKQIPRPRGSPRLDTKTRPILGPAPRQITEHDY